MYIDKLDDTINKFNNIYHSTINPIQDGSFQGCSRMRSQKGPLT